MSIYLFVTLLFCWPHTLVEYQVLTDFKDMRYHRHEDTINARFVQSANPTHLLFVITIPKPQDLTHTCVIKCDFRPQPASCCTGTNQAQNQGNIVRCLAGVGWTYSTLYNSSSCCLIPTHTAQVDCLCLKAKACHFCAHTILSDRQATT